MAVISNDMLFLAQADRSVKARHDAPVSLAELVGQVVDFHEALMDEAGLSIRIEGDRRLPVDERPIKRAQIAQRADGRAQLWVENTRPTVPPEQLPRLFDRIYRVAASRCEVERPPHGLGLSIVAAIARMHDGQPQVESAARRTRVGFTWLKVAAVGAVVPAPEARTSTR